jgi:hypothetical protein
MVARRLASLPAFLLSPVMRRDSDWATLTDICIDLVEFSR